MEDTKIDVKLQNMKKIDIIKKKNRIKIIYKIDKSKQQIKLFGHNFVLRNKNF